MNAVWRDDEYYRASAGSRPKSAGPVSGVPPRTSPAPSTSDVEYVEWLADRFEYGDDGCVLDSAESEWTRNVAAGVVLTSGVVALGAFCIVGAVTVARWLGWA